MRVYPNGDVLYSIRVTSGDGGDNFTGGDDGHHHRHLATPSDGGVNIIDSIMVATMVVLMVLMATRSA